MAIYKTKFPGKTDDEVKDILAAETWILGSEAEAYGLVCTIEHAEKVEMKFAAKLTKYAYKNIPEELKMNAENTHTEEVISEHTEITTSPETTTQDMVVQDEVIDEKKDETPEEQTPENPEEPEKEEPKEPTMDELKEALQKANERIAELEAQLAECGDEPDEEKDTITKDECEKRVQGMQSTMQAKVNDLNAKMNEFQHQLKAKDEELKSAKAEITSLTTSLHDTSEELSKMASAYEEKNKALEMLNSGVNAHAEELPTMEEGLKQCSSPEAKVAFLKSGKYRR